MGQVCVSCIQANSPVPLASSKVADRAQLAPKGISNKLALGAGCYWGTEKFVKKDFQKKFPNSIKFAKVGFMSPDPDNKIKNPSYAHVCSGRTGYVEVLYVELNDPEAHFEELIRFFFQFHDPTTQNRQGNDTGFQYSSCIFCDDEKQHKVASKVKEELQQLVTSRVIRNYYAGIVRTSIFRLTKFIEASKEHQEYLEKNPLGYCNHYIRFKEWRALEEGE